MAAMRISAGYRRYRMFMGEERWRSVLPLSLRKPLFGLLGAAYPKADWAPQMFRAKTTFQALARDSVAGYLDAVSLVREPQRRKLFSAGFRSELQGYEAVEVLRRHAERARWTIPYHSSSTWISKPISPETF